MPVGSFRSVQGTHREEMGLRSVQRLDAGGGECWTNRALSFIEKQGSCLRDVSSGETVRISCIRVVGWQE